MKKQDVYDYLKRINIWYEIDEHKPIYNMKESSELICYILPMSLKTFLLGMIRKIIII